MLGLRRMNSTSSRDVATSSRVTSWQRASPGSRVSSPNVSLFMPAPILPSPIDVCVTSRVYAHQRPLLRALPWRRTRGRGRPRAAAS